MGCSSTKLTPSSSFTYSDSEDDDVDSIAEVTNILNSDENTELDPNETQSYSPGLVVEDKKIICTLSGEEQAPEIDEKDVLHDLPPASQLQHPSVRKIHSTQSRIPRPKVSRFQPGSNTSCTDEVEEKKQISEKCSVTDAAETPTIDCKEVENDNLKAETKLPKPISGVEADRTFSLRNILVKAELKKKQIYTAIRHENDKATIHLSHSFRDTAPVSPVESKENTLTEAAVAESPAAVSRDEDNWYKDDPIETAETDSNPDNVSW